MTDRNHAAIWRNSWRIYEDGVEFGIYSGTVHYVTLTGAKMAAADEMAAIMEKTEPRFTARYLRAEKIA